MKLLGVEGDLFSNTSHLSSDTACHSQRSLYYFNNILLLLLHEQLCSCVELFSVSINPSTHHQKQCEDDDAHNPFPICC